MFSVGARTRQVLGLVGVLLVVVLVWWGQGEEAPRSGVDDTLGATVLDTEISFDDLPEEARSTVGLILSGGPFPHVRDGSVFGNRERLLPVEPHGYYREYTVPTPGSRDRGARRIVHAESGEMFYTEDHYRSFLQIDLTTRE